MLLLIVTTLALSVFALVECAQASAMNVRSMAKVPWAVAIVCLPVLGALAWFALGRPRLVLLKPVNGWTVAPDDDPAFIEALRRRVDAQEELIAQLEQDIDSLEAQDGPEQMA